MVGGALVALCGGAAAPALAADHLSPATAEALASEQARDLPKALDLMRRAADGGDAEAQYHLGRYYNLGVGTPRDASQAAAWYRKAAAQGYVFAKADLGLLEVLGQGTPRDLKAGSALLEAAAPVVPAAASNLCVIYGQGDGAPRDYPRALIWCRLAASRGQPSGELILGQMYDYGLGGLPKDYRLGLAWVLAAASQGFAAAETHMGERVAAGWGVPANARAAAGWWLDAAGKNDPLAEFHLGEAYAKGQGVTADPRQAAAWHGLAANHGVLPSQIWLANAYQLGDGVPVDQNESRRWWIKAAERGDASAQRQAGLALANAPEGGRDDVQALMWLTLSDMRLKAPPLEIEQAAAKARLIARLSREQIALARRRADEWAPPCIGDVAC